LNHHESIETRPVPGTDLPSVVSPDKTSSFPFRRVWVALLVAVAIFLLFALLRARPVAFDSIEIRGNPRFKNQVVAALELLKADSSATYQMVTNYIRLIEQSEITGMAADKAPPTSYVRIPPASIPTISFAAFFAHEAMHSKLYHDYQNAFPRTVVPREIWTGEAVEKQCTEYQLTVLDELAGTDPSNRSHAGFPTNGYFELKEW
jgi:hypothetical protein